MSQTPHSEIRELVDEIQQIMRSVRQSVRRSVPGPGGCERCGKLHTTIVEAVRYHLARFWVLPISEQAAEMEFIEAIRLGLPPGVEITVLSSEVKKILRD